MSSDLDPLALIFNPVERGPFFDEFVASEISMAASVVFAAETGLSGGKLLAFATSPMTDGSAPPKIPNALDVFFVRASDGQALRFISCFPDAECLRSLAALGRDDDASRVAHLFREFELLDELDERIASTPGVPPGRPLRSAVAAAERALVDEASRSARPDAAKAAAPGL